MKLPKHVLCTCYELRRDAGTIDYDNGGQYAPGAVQRIAFQGALLPLSDEDLRYAPQGAYSADSRKLYADGYALAVGAEVEVDEAVYTVTGSRDYGHLGTLRRYTVERRGTAV